MVPKIMSTLFQILLAPMNQWVHILVFRIVLLKGVSIVKYLWFFRTSPK